MKAILLLTSLIISSSLISQRVLPVGNGADDWVNVLLEYEGNMIIAGRFDNLLDEPTQALASWNGVDAPIGLADNTDLVEVFDVIVYQGQLFACYHVSGNDYYVGSVSGTSLDPIGQFDAKVRDLEVYQGQLYAAGDFEELDGTLVTNVVKYNGTTWESVGEPLDDRVNEMAVYEDELYIGGRFEFAGATPLSYIAKLNAGQWTDVNAGLQDNVNDLLATPYGLWMIGSFQSTSAGDVILYGNAVWDGTAYQPLVAMDTQIGGGFTVLVNSPEFGYAISTSNFFISNPQSGNAAGIDLPLFRSMLTYNGTTYVGGFFTYDSYRTFSHFGKLVQGTECASLDKADLRVGICPLEDYEQSLTIPAEGQTGTIYYEGIFAVASDGSPGYYVSPTRYPYIDAIDFFKPGPWAIDLTDSYYEQYHQTWRIDNGMVWNHAAQYDVPGYVPEYSIAQWPTSGNSSNGEPSMIAPFNDIDSDGIYEPLAGEVPTFKGDEALLSIRSDRGMNEVPDLNPVGLDVYTLTYGFDAEAGELFDQTFFREHTIVNRSSLTYDTLYIGFMLDLDIGGYTDDYIGTNVPLDMVFGYNGDMNDELVAGVSGYGEHPPAQGVIVLNQNLNAAVPLSPADPSNQFVNYVNGLLSNGSPQLDQNGNETPYAFYGNPNNAAEWSEVSAGNEPNDRRVMMSIGPFLNVAPDESFCIELAYVYAQDLIGDNLSSVDMLYEKAGNVKSWYESSNVGCGVYEALSIDEPVAIRFDLYPNPANDLVTVNRDTTEEAELILVDMQGRVVMRESLLQGVTSRSLNVAALENGMYLIHMSGSGGGSKRLVLQR